MDLPTIPVSWSTTLLKMDALPPRFAPPPKVPLELFQTCSPILAIVGLGAVVWWRNRRDGMGMRRCVEVSVEMPTPHTLCFVLGYLALTSAVLGVQTLALSVPLGLLGACNFRLAAPKLAEDGSVSMVPGTPLETVIDSPCDVTTPNSRHSKKMFHIHDEDNATNALSRKGTPTSSLLTPPATLPRRRHLSYAPQTPPVPLSERPSFRTRVSSTPSNEIRRTRKSSTGRRYASEACEENLVPKKEVWDTSFELLLYNLSKSRSRNSSLVQSHPRFNVSSPIPPLAPSPLINSS